MNSKMLIGVLVGGIILFMWQSLSWTMLNIHKSQISYTSNQDVILNNLSQHLEEGDYFLPTLPPDATSEDYESFGKEMMGKPWARVSYHKSFDYNGGMNMFRAFVINLLIVFLLVWLLNGQINPTFTKTFLSCLVVGFMAYLSRDYITSIWFETNTIPDLIDTIVSWSLCGIWLGWWLNR